MSESVIERAKAEAERLYPNHGEDIADAYALDFWMGGATFAATITADQVERGAESLYKSRTSKSDWSTLPSHVQTLWRREAVSAFAAAGFDVSGGGGMSAEYLPTTDEVRYSYTHNGPSWAACSGRAADFDRWLAAHDAEVAARARYEGWNEGYGRGAENARAERAEGVGGTQALTDEVLAGIRTRAEKATPGPWRADNRHDDPRVTTVARPRRWVVETYTPADARHVAGLDPTAALALVDQIERLRAEVGDYVRAAIGDDQ